MEIFTTQSIVFEISGYKVSWIELIGTIAGLLSVWFAAKNNILTWPTGIVNVICFFFIFRQTGLFSDMFLQVYYLIVAVYGWYFWKQSVNTGQVNISWLSNKFRYVLLLAMIVFSATLGLLMTRIHIYFPSLFTQPAAYPYSDAFVAVASVIANTLMARKKIESWMIWIAVDISATVIYYQKGILLISAEFFIFTILAVFGLINWIKLQNPGAAQIISNQ